MAIFKKKQHKEHQDLLDKVDKLEQSGMAITKQWYEMWSEGLRYFFSEHDFKIQRYENWDWIVMNYIWPTAMQEIAKLARNYHRIVCEPFNADDESEVEAADVWQGALEWQWRENLDMRMPHLAEIQIGKIFGYRVSYYYWEPKAYWDEATKQWVGEIKYKLWNPAFYWADGTETIYDGNCGTVRWAELEWAQHRWPHAKDDLASIAQSLKDVGGQGESGDKLFRSWMDSGSLKQAEDDTVRGGAPQLPQIVSLIKGHFSDGVEITSETKLVRISQTFLKNYDESEQEDREPLSVDELITEGIVRINGEDGRLIDAGTGVPYDPGDQWPARVRKYKAPDFPNGQFIMSAGEGKDRILLNPEQDDQQVRTHKWPFVVTPHYLLPFMWQGLNAISLYKSCQDMINVSISSLVNHLKQFGDPTIDVEVDAIAKDPKTHQPYKIMSAAGAIRRLVKDGLRRIRQNPPAPLSPGAMAVFQLMSQDFKNMTGLQAIGKGEQLRSGTTATEAIHLVTSSNDRIFLQSVSEDEWCKQSGRLIAELMQLNYEVGRWVRIVGEHKVRGVTQITEKLKSVKYDVIVIPGTSLPFDEEKQKQDYKEAYALFTAPLANPMLPEMLKVLNIPNRQKLLREYPVYQKYRQFVDLYNQVKAGKVDVETAIKMLIQAAVFEFQKEQGVPPNA